ncbi:MAG TPA: hypothetical protein VK186_02060 [Candidatus Deferrimicrobium sp.]|nr:hypothetical protein [Candidatus Deferrimicrobium sp.]
MSTDERGLRHLQEMNEKEFLNEGRHGGAGNAPTECILPLIQ